MPAVFVVASLATYAAFQKHLLPKSVAKWVARCFFWPTIPLTLLRKEFFTEVDKTLVLGHAPITVCGHVETLHEAGVTGVINLCDEYGGPRGAYRRWGIRQLYLPVIDHVEPDLEDLKRGVAFIAEHEEQGGKVFVHCKGGHGRSASVAMAWMMYCEPQKTIRELQRELSALRKVRSRLFAQDNIKSFARWLEEAGHGAEEEVVENTTKSAESRSEEVKEVSRSRDADARHVEFRTRAGKAQWPRRERGEATQKTPLLSDLDLE